MRTPHAMDSGAFKRPHAAFSLIELLVAMAVMAILLILLSQMFTMVANTWNAGRSQVDNFAQARVALDVIARDLEAAVLRPDLPAFFSDNGPQLIFHTLQQSLVSATNNGNRPLSCVSYSVTNLPDASNLRRVSRGYNFGDDVGYAATNWRVSLGNVTFDSDIGPGVLVMRQQFFGTNGMNILPEKVNAAWTNSGANAGVGDLRAAVISIAVVDREMLRVLSTTGKLTQLQNNFSSADPGVLRSFASAWQDQLDDSAGSLLQGGVPPRVLRGLRIFERTVLLPAPRE